MSEETVQIENQETDAKAELEAALKQMSKGKTKAELMKQVLKLFEVQENMIMLLKVLTDDNASATSKHFARLRTHDIVRAYKAGIADAELQYNKDGA